MTPSIVALDHLAQLAKQLNAKTDDLNELISELEDHLASMRLGVSEWDGELLSKEREPTRGTVDSQVGYNLGYAKVSREWRLCVRRVRQVQGLTEEDEPYVDYQYLDEPSPLEKAPRAVRAEAAARFDSLLNRLTQRVRGFLENIDRARAHATTRQAPCSQQSVDIHIDVEDVLSDVADDLACRLVNEDDEVTGAIAETNATGFGLDTWDVTRAELSAAELDVDLEVVLQGDQDDDRPANGDQLTVALRAEVEFVDGEWKLAEYEVESVDSNA